MVIPGTVYIKQCAVGYLGPQKENNSPGLKSKTAEAAESWEKCQISVVRIPYSVANLCSGCTFKIFLMLFNQLTFQTLAVSLRILGFNIQKFYTILALR